MHLTCWRVFRHDLHPCIDDCWNLSALARTPTRTIYVLVDPFWDYFELFTAETKNLAATFIFCIGGAEEM